MDAVTQSSRHNEDIRDTGSGHGGDDLHTLLCLYSVYSGLLFRSHSVDIPLILHAGCAVMVIRTLNMLVNRTPELPGILSR